MLKNTIRCTLDAADHRVVDVVAVHGVPAIERFSQVEHAIVVLHDQHKSEYIVTFWSDLNGVEFDSGRYYGTDRRSDAMAYYWERCRRAEEDLTIAARLDG